MVAEPYGYLERDNWTGRITGCYIFKIGDAQDIKVQRELRDAGFTDDEIDKYSRQHPLRSMICRTLDQ